LRGPGTYAYPHTDGNSELYTNTDSDCYGDYNSYSISQCNAIWNTVSIPSLFGDW